MTRVYYLQRFREAQTRAIQEDNPELANQAGSLIDIFENFGKAINRFATRYGTIALEEMIDDFYESKGIERKHKGE